MVLVNRCLKLRMDNNDAPLFCQYIPYKRQDIMSFLFFKEGFRRAMQMVGEEFLDRLEFYQSSWLPARAVVEEAVKKRLRVCS